MSLDGITKTAVLLMVLGEEEASGVFKYLGPREVQKIGGAMAGIKNVSREDIAEAVSDFLKAAGEQTGLGLDSDNYLRKVLTKALGPEKGGQIIDRIIQGEDTRGIEGLKWMDSEAVAELIKNEHPQIIATVLVHLDRDQASEIVGHFSDRTRNDVMLRIATLEGIQPAALRELDSVLSGVLAGGDLKRSLMGGVGPAAEILNFMKGEQEKGVLDNVRAYDSDLADRIVDSMFTFENLIDLENVAIQLLIKEVPQETLVIALKGADPELRAKFMSCMSRRAAELFAEDIESRGPVRLSEVEEQQRAILGTVRTLSENGQIALGKSAEDAYVQ